ncbi:aldehyde dehydrogenase family protein [Mumia zhuanghuii]|uniref:Aldehyde dehydrogenase family protein n=2 Tax=Mumia TaxID=1546255 RepID=A0ABW1QI55_9ACTN|nr:MULTISPECIES: aldehyde dehydrogenase family protein [Mumia]KAA1418224.1 aldehyde dehydrogenase family protein [Mumia zhuanghuii]
MTATVSFRPATGERAGSVRDSLPPEVSTAVDRAAAAAPVISATSPRERQVWLEAIAQTLLDHRDELVRLADCETALGRPRLTGEVERAAAQLRFYAEVAVEGSFLDLTVDHASGTAPGLVRLKQPLGPVAVFGASNFPFAFGVLGNDTASALAAGCPVVAKAHPAHVLLCARLGDLAVEALAAAGAPAGTFGQVVGFDAGVQLVREPAVRAVGFTGSQAGGMALWRLANEREVVIPVYAEMGTVNPVVMTPGSLVRTSDIASGFVGSFTLGSGQFCTKPGLLLAPAGHGVATAVAEALAATSPAATMLTRGIADAAGAGVSALVEAGAEVVARVEGGGEGWSADSVVLAAPSAALHAGSRLLEECFGPVAVVVEYATVAEAVSVLGLLQGSLTATVVTDGTEDDPDAAPLVTALARNAGRVTVNDWPTGVAWTWAQQHGGPWPATSAPASTSVGAAALDRFVRPVSYQSVPDPWLPAPARTSDPWQLPRRVDGRLELG